MLYKWVLIYFPRFNSRHGFHKFECKPGQLHSHDLLTGSTLSKPQRKKIGLPQGKPLFFLFVDQAVDPEFQCIKSHLLQLIYLKYRCKWMLFLCFHFTYNIVLSSFIRTKLSTKIVEIKNYRAFTCVYNLGI